MPNRTVATGGDSFILSSTKADKPVDVKDRLVREFKLNITIRWEEYRQPSQAAGSLWLFSSLGRPTSELPSISPAIQITPNVTTLLEIVSMGAVSVHYTGQANAHVWLSYFAEFID